MDNLYLETFPRRLFCVSAVAVFSPSNRRTVIRNYSVLNHFPNYVDRSCQKTDRSSGCCNPVLAPSPVFKLHEGLNPEFQQLLRSLLKWPRTSRCGKFWFKKYLTHIQVFQSATTANSCNGTSTKLFFMLTVHNYYDLFCTTMFRPSCKSFASLCLLCSATVHRGTAVFKCVFLFGASFKFLSDFGFQFGVKPDLTVTGPLAYLQSLPLCR